MIFCGKTLTENYNKKEKIFIINFLIKLLRILPHGAALLFGRFAGRVARLILWKKTDRCEARCVKALGVGVTIARKIIKKSFINMGMSLVEFVRSPVMMRDVKKFAIFDDESKKILTEALSRGHGVILMCSHMDNWELAAMRVSSEGFPLHVVYTQQSNKDGDDFIKKIRTENEGMILIPSEGAGLRDIFRTLRAGGILVIMQDLDARSDGIILNFLGLPASTHEGTVKLYQKFKCPIIPVHYYRDKKNPALHNVKFTEILSDRPGFGEDLKKSLEICNSVIENWIKETPEQWFWIMDRWESVMRRKNDLGF